MCPNCCFTCGFDPRQQKRGLYLSGTVSNLLSPASKPRPPDTRCGPGSQKPRTREALFPTSVAHLANSHLNIDTLSCDKRDAPMEKFANFPFPYCSWLPRYTKGRGDLMGGTGPDHNHTRVLFGHKLGAPKSATWRNGWSRISCSTAQQ